MSITFDLSDLDGLDNRLAMQAIRIERAAGSDKTKKAIKAALKPLNDDAKARIHSITGRLAGAIETKVESHYDAPTEIEVGISYKRHKNAHHAHLVEGGHGGPHPAPEHPFWAPAVEAHGEDAVEALENLANEMLEEIFK